MTESDHREALWSGFFKVDKVKIMNKVFKRIIEKLPSINEDNLNGIIEEIINTSSESEVRECLIIILQRELSRRHLMAKKMSNFFMEMKQKMQN